MCFATKYCPVVFNLSASSSAIINISFASLILIFGPATSRPCSTEFEFVPCPFVFLKPIQLYRDIYDIHMAPPLPSPLFPKNEPFLSEQHRMPCNWKQNLSPKWSFSYPKTTSFCEQMVYDDVYVIACFPFWIYLLPATWSQHILHSSVQSVIVGCVQDVGPPPPQYTSRVWLHVEIMNQSILFAWKEIVLGNTGRELVRPVLNRSPPQKKLPDTSYVR